MCSVYLFFFLCYRHHRDLHSFPTRRSSDLLMRNERPLMFFALIGLLLVAAALALGIPVVIDWTHTGKVERRSEEHTSELQSRPHLVCRLLLEKKKRTSGPGTAQNPTAGAGF